MSRGIAQYLIAPGASAFTGESGGGWVVYFFRVVLGGILFSNSIYQEGENFFVDP